jgi:gliding motility-associated GldM-like protein
MKHLLLIPALSIGMLSFDNPTTPVEKKINPQHRLSLVDDHPKVLDIITQTETGSCRMPSVVFRSQEFCRAELKDFDFNAHFNVVGATVYFTGKNFEPAETGTITSSSLKPISNLMARCVPGSVIIFDDVKVVGPDKMERTIPGITIMLY